MHYKAVLFDMDGLLLDSERQYLESFSQTCAQFDLSNMEQVFYDCIGLRSADSSIVLQKALGHLVDLAAFNAAWVEHAEQRRANNIPLKSGAQELLSLLQDAGIPRMVATSTRTQHALQHLQKAGIYDLITHVVGGDQVTLGKPEPEIYLKAAATAGFDANDCAAFEDSDPGTLAAVRSGATTVQVPDLKPPSQQTLALGHVVARDLLAGAQKIGLI
ncbi:HAD family hydrolase [Rhodobacteraceae bacterium nBUS_24]